MNTKLLFFALTLLSIRAFAQTGSIKNATTPPYVRNSLEDSLNNHPAGDAMEHARDKVTTQNHDIKNDQKNELNYGANAEMHSGADTMMTHRKGTVWHSDGVMMHDGYMLMIKDGKETRMDHDMTLDNGTKVRSNGNIVTKDGKVSKMQEGQHMDMSGTMVPMQKNKSDKGVKKAKGSMEHDDMKSPKNKQMYLVPDSTVKKDSLH